MKFFLILFFSSVAFAAEAPATLDMKTAIEKGLAFSPDVQKARSLVVESEANFRMAEAQLFPTISAQGLTRTNRNVTSYDPTLAAGNALLNSLYNETYTVGLIASQPIYKGGAISAGLSGAKVQEKIAQQTLFQVKQDYLQNLLSAYFNASENDQKLEMAKLNRDILKGYLEVTQKYVSIGRSKIIDRLQADANYQLSEAEILRLETAEEQSVQDLLKLTGDTDLAHAKLETHFEAEPVQVASLDEAFSRAIKNNPDLRIQRLNVDYQNDQNDLNMATNWPSLSLDGTIGYNSPDRTNVFDPNAQYYTVGFTLTVPLFSGLSSFAQRRSNAEVLRQREKDVVIHDLAVKENLAVAMATVERNFLQLKLSRRGAESARKAMDAALKSYREGLVTSTDIITIQKTRYDAETQFLTAQFSYLRQILNLRHDLGVDLEKTYGSR